MERDAARVAGTLRGVSGHLPELTTPQSAARAGVHRRAIRRRLPPVLRRAHQLDASGSLHHGGPAWFVVHQGGLR